MFKFLVNLVITPRLILYLYILYDFICFFNKDFKEPFGFGTFRILGAKKTFIDKTSSVKDLCSEHIEIIGFKWLVSISIEDNDVGI